MTSEREVYLGSLEIHNFLHDQIALVPNQKFVHLVGGVLVNLTVPGLYIIKAVLWTSECSQRTPDLHGPVVNPS